MTRGALSGGTTTGLRRWVVIEGRTVDKCSEVLWNVPGNQDEFWKKSYHTLFYAHLYLQNAENDFVPWEKHHDPDGGVPFTKEEVLEYVAFVEKQVVERIPVTDMEAESGFYWYPVNKLELQFINIRHIQQHAGELYERLGTLENVELGWEGFSHNIKEPECPNTIYKRHTTLDPPNLAFMRCGKQAATLNRTMTRTNPISIRTWNRSSSPSRREYAALAQTLCGAASVRAIAEHLRRIYESMRN